MYLVVNQSKRLITLSDLDVSIRAGTMLDLDVHKKNKHLNPRNSKDLQEALRRGILRTMKNDKPKKKEPTSLSDSSETPVQSGPDMAEMMKLMKETIREEMERNKPEPAQQITLESKEDNSLIMLEMMKEIKGLIASGAINGSDATKFMEQIDIDDELDEDKIKEIHAAAMKKMKNKSGIKSEISYDTNTVKDESISDNLDDLENLI